MEDISEGIGGRFGEVDFGGDVLRGRRVLNDLQCFRIDQIGELLLCRSSIFRVELNPEILMRTSRIVTGSQEHSAYAISLFIIEMADIGGAGRSGHESALSHMQFINPIGTSQPNHNPNHLRSQVPPVSSNKQRVLICIGWGITGEGLLGKGVEVTLDEVFHVVRLDEDRDLLTQPGCTRFLALEGSGHDSGEGNRVGYGLREHVYCGDIFRVIKIRLR